MSTLGDKHVNCFRFLVVPKGHRGASERLEVATLEGE
jgi:hypothetical protein